MSRAMDYLTQGVYIVGVNDAKARNLMTAAWVSQIASDKLMLAVGKTHYTAELIGRSGHFGLSVLTAEQKEIALRCGKSSGRTADKLKGLDLCATEQGDPLIAGAAAHFSCRVEKVISDFDHVLFCAEVVDSRAFSGEPMRYRPRDFF